jgi:hypothetical protein
MEAREIKWLLFSPFWEWAIWGFSDGADKFSL